MEQYGTENLIVITKVMYTYEHFIMETSVIFYVISLEMSKNDIKNYVKDSNEYFGLDN